MRMLCPSKADWNRVISAVVLFMVCMVFGLWDCPYWCRCGMFGAAMRERVSAVESELLRLREQVMRLEREMGEVQEQRQLVWGLLHELRCEVQGMHAQQRQEGWRSVERLLGLVERLVASHGETADRGSGPEGSSLPNSGRGPDRKGAPGLVPNG